MKDKRKKIIDALEGIEDTTLRDMIIEAEDGEDFQEYNFLGGKKVPAGTPVGIEVKNPRTGEVELHLFKDIEFRSD
jgi:hypothetical protein